jgi:hypothetical protein
VFTYDASTNTRPTAICPIWVYTASTNPGDSTSVSIFTTEIPTSPINTPTIR